jgi:hypothetical protein
VGAWAKGVAASPTMPSDYPKTTVEQCFFTVQAAYFRRDYNYRRLLPANRRQQPNPSAAATGP